MDARQTRFVPAAFSDLPLYNIQAVAAATGVATITLRSWERRYGIPRPKRDPKGYRLYSDRDIAITRWLKERVDQGIGISRAVNMLHLLEDQQHEESAEQTLDFDSLRARLLSAIATLSETRINQVVAEALMVASVEDVCLKLLEPALYVVGEYWQRGRLTVTAEHVGSHLIRAQVSQLIRISPPPIREQGIVVGCAPGELHEIGALIVALFLRRRGFRVTYLGASVEKDDLLEDVRRIKPSAVCLSAATPGSLEPLRGILRALAEGYSGYRCFGGKIFRQDPALAEGLDGIYLGPDAGAGTRMLEELLVRTPVQAPSDGPELG